MGLASEHLLKCGGEARLADAGLTCEQHHAPLAALGLRPSAHKQLDLLLAPDERWESGRVQCLEAALDGARVQHLPRPDRLGKAFELDSPEVAVLEEIADQPARPRPNHDGVRLGQRLQPGGQVGRLADDRLLLRRSGTDEIAHDHEPGVDPDPTLQLGISARL